MSACKLTYQSRNKMKMSTEGIHVYGMRDGDAGYILLASETHSPYVDNGNCWRRKNPKSACKAMSRKRLRERENLYQLTTKNG